MAEGGIIIILKKKNGRVSRGDFGELSEGICPHSTPLDPPSAPSTFTFSYPFFISSLDRLGACL
jgi:hypothetical protein